jgi:hypothetical protein
VLEIVRPGMEDSESGEKQENTGIGPASACRDSPTPSRVPDAVQRVTEWSGAPLIRDRHRLERSRVCRAPQRNQVYADCVNLSALLRCARDTRARRILAKRTQRVLPESSPRKRGAMITAGGYGSRLSARFRGRRPGRHRLERAKHQPAGARNRGRGNLVVLGLLFTTKAATPTCLAPRGPMCHPPNVTPQMSAAMWHHPSSSQSSLSVVIMCFAFEAPMPARRIHITTSNPPPGPRPR